MTAKSLLKLHALIDKLAWQERQYTTLDPNVRVELVEWVDAYGQQQRREGRREGKREQAK